MERFHDDIWTGLWSRYFSVLVTTDKTMVGPLGWLGISLRLGRLYIQVYVGRWYVETHTY